MKKFLTNPLLVLSSLTLISIFTGSMIAPIESRFLTQITGSSSYASFAFTIATFASILGTLWLSRLANKVGRDKVIHTAFIISAFFPLLYSFTQNTFQAYGIKFAWAFAAAGTGTVLRAFIQEEVSVFKGKEGTFYGIIYSLQSGAGAVGSIFGGIISDKFGFFSVFRVVFIISLLQALILIILFRTNRSKGDDVKEAKQKGSFREGVKYIWINKILRARFILVTVFGINWSTKVILYPLILFALSGLDSFTGAVFSVQGITALIVLPIIGKIVDKVGYSKVLKVGYFCLGLGVLTLALTPYVWLIWVAAATVAAGEACNGPGMSKLETINIPNYLRNSVVAVQDVYTTVVELFSTFLTGIMLAFLQPRVIMFIMGVLIFISLAMSTFIMRNTKVTNDISVHVK